MKKMLFALLFLAAGICASAQRVFFVYVQSEKGAPFYVKMGDKIHSSTASGYLILSSLKDSTYSVSIGYAKSTAPESKFAIRIQDGDKGFLVKNLEEGVVLFDLQNLTLTKPIAAVSSNSGQQSIVRTDAFTKLLAQAADDASLLYVAVPVKTEPEETKATIAVAETPVPVIIKDTAKIETASVAVVVPPSIVADSSTIKSTTETTGEPEKETAKRDTAIIETTPEVEPAKDTILQIATVDSVATIPFVKSTITRRSESSTTEGFGLVFLDNENGVVDTIRLLIPTPKKLFQEPVATETATEEVKKEEQLPVKDASPTTISASKNTCVNTASDKDFLKLRKNMAAETNDERMIASAAKSFKTKCFTTEQIKNLSALFLTAAAKYQFFDAAFGHVADPENFTLLGTEIKDEYYTRRFKALTGE